jgi:hypothetical protein
VIKYAAGELDIFPGGSLPGGIPKKRGGVVRNDEGNAVVAMNLTPQFADAQLRFK